MNYQEFKDDPRLMFDFLDFFLQFRPHNYQKEFLLNCLNHNKVLGLWPRQSGKSTTVSAYCVARCSIEPTAIMIIAPTQTQSSELFMKIKTFVESNETLTSHLSKSTQTEMIWQNGSRIKALPSGPEGKTIKGFTADIVIIEEAGLMKDEIVNAVIMPMLASKKDKGQVIKIGTPLTRNHFYRSCFQDKNYFVSRVTWKECVEEGQYTQSLVDEQRRNMVDVQFKTEYCSDFISEEREYFSLQLVESCMENYKLIQIV